MKPVFFGQALRLFLPLILPFLFQVNLDAVTVFSKQSGSWTSTSTWQGGVVPSYNDYIIIQENHQVTNSNPFTQNGFLEVRGTLVLSGNTVRSFNPDGLLEIDGLLIIQGGTTHIDCVTAGSGTFRQTGGSTYFEKYHVNTTDLQGGSTYFYGPLDIEFPNLLLKNAKLDGSEDLEVSESMSWGNNGIVDQGTKLIIKEGATLDFVAGGVWKNSGDLYNYGTVNCPNGSMIRNNSNGTIGNNGLWRFLATAGTTSSFDFQHFVNNEQSIKEAGGTVTFLSSSEFYQSTAAAILHLKGGAFNMKETASLGLQGLWQIDAGAILNYTPGTLGNYATYIGAKIINNGQIQGTLWRIAGGDDMILEGNGKIERLEMVKTSGSNILLAGSPEITTEFILTSGRMLLNQYDLRLGTASVDIVDYDSYIYTNGTGGCVCLCPVGSAVIYPVGNNGFAPFVLTLKTGSTQDFVKVRVTDSFYGEYNGSTPACNDQIPVGVVGHNWYVAEQTAGGTLADVVAYWSPGSERIGFDNTNCTLGRYVGGNWEPDIYMAAIHPPLLSAVYSQGITDFGIFGVFDAGHEADVNFITPAAVANAPLCEWNDLQMQANTSPNAQTQWSGPNGFQSNEHNPSISGVQLSQAGVYTIVASQYGCPAKQASLNVQVNAEPNPSILGPTLIQLGETAELTAYGGIDFAWNTGETTKSIIVAPTQTTDYQVTVTSAEGCTASTLHTVQVSSTSASHEAEGSIGQMKVQPNPASESTMLMFESAVSGDIRLSVTDSRGAQLFQQNAIISSGINQINISLANYPAGTYQLTLISGSEVKTIRLVKMMRE